MNKRIKEISPERLNDLEVNYETVPKGFVPFSKIEFHESFWTFRKGMPVWGDEEIIFLDIPKRELSVQVIRTGQDLSNKIYSIEAGWRLGYPNENVKQMLSMRVGKNGFQHVQVQAKDASSKVIFSAGIELREEQMKKLLPLCNALDFEPFRNREMSMDDPGYRGYRDEITMWFRGITDSYIPKIELPMELLYDEKHTWPSERLYQYLWENYLRDNKKLSPAKIYRKA